MCLKGSTTTHLRSRWGRVETEEGCGEGVVSHDTCSASRYGTIDLMSIQPATISTGQYNRQRSCSVMAASGDGSVDVRVG